MPVEFRDPCHACASLVFHFKPKDYQPSKANINEPTRVKVSRQKIVQ